MQEFLEEGQALLLYVFTKEYYLTENRLILSASIDGKQIETIELSLGTVEVLQYPDWMNQNSEYHEHIIKLRHRNIKQTQSRTA